MGHQTHMLKVADIVTVVVTSPQVFGVFCRYESQDLLVLIPETSWIASFNSCHQFAQAGDRLTVRIQSIDTISGKIAASVRHVFSDPWETDQLAVGSTHLATVVRFVESADRCDNEPAYLLELLPGAYTMLCADGLSLAAGQEIAVTIAASDPQRHAVGLKLAA